MSFTREALALIETAALDAANAEREPFRYRYSAAGGECLRALCLDAKAGARDPMPNLKQVIAAECGTTVGDVMEAGATRLGWRAQEYVELPDCSVLVTGHLDCANDDTVLDFKVVKEKRWRWLLKHGPSFQYRMQIASYATSSGRKNWALVYLRGKTIYDDGELEWKIYGGVADPALALAMARIWERVDAHKTAGTLPPIPGSFTKESYPCAWPRSRTPGACPHFATCWEKPNVRNANDGSAERARPELLPGAAADDPGHVRERSDGSGVSGLHGGGAGAGAEPDHPADPSREAVERGAEAKRLDAADGN